MIREIITDKSILEKQSVAYRFKDAEDKEQLQDFIDTVIAHKEDCVGLAMPQIGVNKSVIAYLDTKQKNFYLMFNPVVVRASKNTWSAREGCLSQPGVDVEVTRPMHITVAFMNIHGKAIRQDFGGYTARIIQHEIDHLRGKLLPNQSADVKVGE